MPRYLHIALLLLCLQIAEGVIKVVPFLQVSSNEVDGTTIAAVYSEQYLDTANTYSTLTAPENWEGFGFTHWTNDSYPTNVYRDVWGRAYNPISFTLLENTICTAHYLPTDRDTDADDIPDWYEIQYYGDLDEVATSDGDTDGLDLLTEYNGGTHPLYGNSSTAGGVSNSSTGLITCNLANYASYTLSSLPAGTVDEFGYAAPGSLIHTPDMSGNADFGYWELDGVRLIDLWGRSYPQISFTMADTDRTAVAYLFPGDTDGDGIADAVEMAYYGSLDNDANSDTDGDGLTLLQEIEADSNPLYGNSSTAGGVSHGSSEMVTVNLADYSRYTLASNPAGTVDETAIVRDGTVITTPNMTQANFAYWTLDGVRQEDAWGVALRQLSFTMSGEDRTAIAYLIDGDSDGDGVDDAFEQYYFGNLDQSATSDGDGDGVDLLTEFTTGGNPIYGESSTAGGVSWGDSEMVVANLQPYERLGKMLVGSVLSPFFSTDPDLLTGIQAGTWSSAAASDWDASGTMDLFIAHESGLRVFENIGTPYNPNFSEVLSGFGGLATYIAGITRPKICGGDWSGDGIGDLVIGGNTGTLRFVASGGTFSSDGTGTDLVISSTTTSPALGDMDGDGLLDLLVLLDDGTVSLYLNDGVDFPYDGEPLLNYLGVTATNAVSISVGDINGDNVPDVLLSDSDGRIWEFHNNGSGFDLISKVWGGSYPNFAGGLTLAAIDLEGDGDLDVVGGLENGGLIALRDPRVGRPTGLVARPGANSIQLEWNPNRQSRIRGYYVYRATAELG
ncbi:MAG: FG-GAP repeat domain-containing protein, partial [Luteolibacter sp.]